MSSLLTLLVTNEIRVIEQPQVQQAAERDGGVLRANKTGETSILIRAAGHAVSAMVGVIGPSIKDYPSVPTRNYIDQLVFAKLRKFNILPSAMSGDEEFIRRVCLDATGTLPPPQRSWAPRLRRRNPSARRRTSSSPATPTKAKPAD